MRRLRINSTYRWATLRLSEIARGSQQKFRNGRRKKRAPGLRWAAECNCSCGKDDPTREKNDRAVMIRFVGTVTVHMQRIVERGGDRRRAEHEDQRNSERRDQAAKPRHRSYRDGSANKHVCGRNS